MTDTSDIAGGPPADDRQIVMSRIIDAPRDVVFEAFTEVRHLSQWWGPDGFTTTTHSFEFRVGGVWEFVMHGPDGIDYPNWIMWRTIDRPKLITLLHGNSEDDPDAFESILTFKARGDATEIVMRNIFRTKQLRDQAAEEYRAIERGQQTLGRLAKYVTGNTSNGEGNV